MGGQPLILLSDISAFDSRNGLPKQISFHLVLSLKKKKSRIPNLRPALRGLRDSTSGAPSWKKPCGLLCPRHHSRAPLKRVPGPQSGPERAASHGPELQTQRVANRLEAWEPGGAGRGWRWERGRLLSGRGGLRAVPGPRHCLPRVTVLSPPAPPTAHAAARAHSGPRALPGATCHSASPASP